MGLVVTRKAGEAWPTMLLVVVSTAAVKLSSRALVMSVPVILLLISPTSWLAFWKGSRHARLVARPHACLFPRFLWMGSQGLRVWWQVLACIAGGSAWFLQVVGGSRSCPHVLLAEAHLDLVG